MKKVDFDKLPKAEQRVLIAKDLIARLDAKKVIAAKGVYISKTGGGTFDLDSDTQQVADVLNAQPCRVCGIGGLFLCAVDRHDRLTARAADTGGMGDGVIEFDYLERWFSPDTLAIIERAFEGWSSFEDVLPHASADRRMREIANNIIRNKGTFKTEQFKALK